jgi:hypothetical protein
MRVQQIHERARLRLSLEAALAVMANLDDLERTLSDRLDAFGPASRGLHAPP